MPMAENDIKELKAMLAVAAKREVNFGLCLGEKEADTIIVMSRQKDGKSLSSLAKKSAGTSSVCHGSATLAAKTLTLLCEVKPPSGMAKNVQNMLKTHGVSLTIKLGEEGQGQVDAPKKGVSGIETGAHPDQNKWNAETAELATLFDSSVSRLPEAQSLRAARDFALASAEERDFTAAFKSLTKVKGDFEKALKAHGAVQAAKFTKAYDEVKDGLSETARDTLSKVLKEAVTSQIGVKSAPDIEAAVAKLLKALAQSVMADKGQVAGDRQALANSEKKIKQDATKQITALTKDVTELEAQVKKAKAQTNALRNALNQKQKNNQKKNVLVGEERSKAQNDVTKLEKEIKAKQSEMQKKRDELAPVVKQIQESRDETLTAMAAQVLALDDRITQLAQSLPELPFKDIHAALASTIGEQADAMEWREGKDGVGGEVRRNADGNGHGSARHGAQTGIERQARRAATDGVAPDGGGTNAQTRKTRGTGVTTRITQWKQISIEYDEEDGEKKIKSRKELQKAILGEVATWTDLPADGSSSVFANPVLEKLAVDTAIKRMDDKGWTQVQTNAGWQALTNVTVYLGPPSRYGKSYKGWGYSLSRKEVGAMSLTEANRVLDEFETGKITEEKMLERLGVKYLMDSGVVAMVPYVRVALKRANVNSPWQSVTHFPDKVATAEDLRVNNASILGWNVMKGTKTETASL